GERSIRLGAGQLAEAVARGPGEAQRQRRRDLAGPSARRVGHEADDDVGARAQSTRQTLRPADDVRRRRPGERHHLREAVAVKLDASITAVITGGASGLGAATARALA